MLTTIQEYDDINRLTFHIMLSQVLSPLAKTGKSANIFDKEFFFC